MSTHDERRQGHGAGRQGQRQGERQTRQRREPLFPLEADDGAPRGHGRPPAPLGDLLGDLDEVMPVRSLPPRHSEAKVQRAAPPPPRQEPPPERRGDTIPDPLPRRATAEREPQPRHTPALERKSEAPRQAADQRPVATKTPRPSQELRLGMLADLLQQPLQRDTDRAHYDTLDAELARLQLAEARPRLSPAAVPQAPQAASLTTYLVLGAICVLSLLVIITLSDGGSAGPSRWNPFQPAESQPAGESLVGAARTAGDYALKGPPSITPQQIERILEAYGSPAVGSGELFYTLGLKYGIDPAYAVAFFIHESSAGTNPRWDGMKVFDANDTRRSVTTHNIGNISCAGYSPCLGRWRDYPSWAEGIEDWYRLIDVEYIQGRGHQTVADVIPVYAPSFENDVQRYVDAVNGLVSTWRTAGVP